MGEKLGFYHGDNRVRDVWRFRKLQGQEWEFGFSDLIADIADWQVLLYHGVFGDETEGHGGETGKEEKGISGK